MSFSAYQLEFLQTKKNDFKINSVGYFHTFTVYVVVITTMARSIQIEFARALYPVCAIGDQQENIFLGD